jgi:predicted metal-dependent hydrolase
MLKENHNLKNALKTYIKMLDSRAYFDAHEVLEEAWHPLRKANHPLKNLAKGLINGAICFEHLKRNREDSKRKALTVLKSYERHKHLCVEGIEHYELFKEACSKIKSLKKSINHL